MNGDSRDFDPFLGRLVYPFLCCYKSLSTDFLHSLSECPAVPSPHVIASPNRVKLRIACRLCIVRRSITQASPNRVAHGSVASSSHRRLANSGLRCFVAPRLHLPVPPRPR
ncbi:hypothetical protein MA16_Dca003359 [Dendrobium catenatum]|uniref:Uncharacterized protein n=1 Tax=Dendrobium catenatum TaxID=906689 RepID=A0A2I0XCG8_9ASPA|nr:hypothetical protein MA16_Dca003359 [Dendrobium catenatum]